MIYLLQLLHDSALRAQLLGGVRGANIANMNQQMLSALDIPLPPIELQNQFAAFVEQADKSKFVTLSGLKTAVLRYEGFI